MGDSRERAAGVRRDALAHLQGLAGDAALCAIARSGRSFPAAKYHEGRQAAAAQVLRQPDGAALELLRTRWRADQAASSTRGADWQAYAQGGLDALDEITGTS